MVAAHRRARSQIGGGAPPMSLGIEGRILGRGPQRGGAGAFVDRLDGQGSCGGPEMGRVVVAALVGKVGGLPGQIPGRPLA